jgi:hypothetical protein
MTRVTGPRRRMLMIAAVCGVIAAHDASGQNVAQIVFIPQTYFIGDLVEARVLVRSSAALDLEIPEQLPEREWLDFRSVSVGRRADGYEVRIVFQPFFVGTRQLPDLDLGSIVLPGVSAVVSSVGEESELSLYPVRDQLLLPGTQILILAIVLALVGVPLVLFSAGGWVRRNVQVLVERYRENRPYRALQKGLRSIQSEMHELDGKRFYIRLLDLMRGYLGGRFAAEIRSATSNELDLHLGRSGIPEEEREPIVQLFRFGDLVKFANRRVTVDERERHLQLVREITSTLQRHGKEHSDVGA